MWCTEKHNSECVSSYIVESTSVDHGCIIAYEYHHRVSKRKIFYNPPTPSEPLSTRSELNYYQTLDRKQLSQHSKLFGIE
jgi:hypothetical protein